MQAFMHIDETFYFLMQPLKKVARIFLNLPNWIPKHPISSEISRVKLRVKIRLPVQWDGHQGEDTDVDTQDLHSGAKLAHKSRQIPTLKQSSMELKGNSEKSYGHVSKGQVRNIHVRDSSHPSVRKIHNLSLLYVRKQSN